MVSGNSGATGCATTARLLVLGDKQVGKSAAIVRYTTGRYIQEYSKSTNYWLYKHSLDCKANNSAAQSIELLEQKDLKIFDSSNLFAVDSTAIGNAANQSLASRVAMDQQQANVLHEKQELMSKLHWANAYVVIYAINEISSFNKAIKYLNLIANSINNNTVAPRCGSSTSSSSTSTSTTTSSSTSTCDHNQLDHLLNQFIQLTSSANKHSSSSSGGSKEQLDPTVLASLAAQTTATWTHSSQRRPILLLGNKRDLERQGRQVSLNDGRLLAMRHQSMFAEVSIAETHKLIDLHLATLIDHIDPSNLHVEHNNHQQPVQAELNHWRPSIEMALVQTNVNVAAPIWASLIKPKSSLTTAGPLPVAKIVKSCAIGGQVAQSAQVSHTKGVKSPMAVQSLTKQNQGLHSTNHRYETLKSSFIRASMAIVSSKALAKSSRSVAESTTLKQRPSVTSNNSDHSDYSIMGDLSNLSNQSTCEQINEHVTVGHLNWFRNHLALKNNKQPEATTNAKTSSVCSLESSHVKQAGSQLSLAAGIEAREKSSGRRLLFRYKNRRKTVAFKPIEVSSVDTSSLNETSSDLTYNLEISRPNGVKSILHKERRQNETDYNPGRCSSNRSSSSLSTTTTDTPYLCGSLARREQCQVAALSESKNSRTNSNRPLQPTSSSSRASTPDASYEDSGDELLDHQAMMMVTQHQRAALKSSSLSSSSSSSTPSAPVITGAAREPIKRRYQLVKSVQSTLANMTMSSRSANVANVTTKRSFCNSLFKHQPTIEAKKVVGDAPVLLAKTEHIRTRPTMVGYCK